MKFFADWPNEKSRDCGHIGGQVCSALCCKGTVASVDSLVAAVFKFSVVTLCKVLNLPEKALGLTGM